MTHSLPTRSRRRRALLAAVLASIAPTICALPAGAAPPQGSYEPHVEYRVDAAGDEADASIGDAVCRTTGGSCTLRAALQEAAVDHATSTIRFALLSSTKNMIRISTALPAIRYFAGPTIIDGGRPLNFEGDWPMIELRGPGPNSRVNGLAITSPGNTVRNLSIYNFRNQIRITNWSNRIEGNMIGTSRDGRFAASPLTIADDTAGVLLDGDAANNVIDGNAISGNADIGVLVSGTASANSVLRNQVGLTPGGARPNGSHGVVLGASTRFNSVGRDRALGNAIAANRGSGVQVGGTLNRVAGNTIGIRLETGHVGAVTSGPQLVAPNSDTNVVVGPSAEARISENLMIGKPDGVVIGTQTDVPSNDSGITGPRVTSNEVGRVISDATGAATDPTGATGVTVWQGSYVVLAYNAVRRQQIGFQIAERLPTPVTRIGNLLEDNATNVVFR